MTTCQMVEMTRRDAQTRGVVGRSVMLPEVPLDEPPEAQGRRVSRRRLSEGRLMKAREVDQRLVERRAQSVRTVRPQSPDLAAHSFEPPCDGAGLGRTQAKRRGSARRVEVGEREQEQRIIEEVFDEI